MLNIDREVKVYGLGLWDDIKPIGKKIGKLVGTGGILAAGPSALPVSIVTLTTGIVQKKNVEEFEDELPYCVKEYLVLTRVIRLGITFYIATMNGNFLRFNGLDWLTIRDFSFD